MNATFPAPQDGDPEPARRELNAVSGCRRNLWHFPYSRRPRSFCLLYHPPEDSSACFVNWTPFALDVHVRALTPRSGKDLLEPGSRSVASNSRVLGRPAKPTFTGAFGVGLDRQEVRFPEHAADPIAEAAATSQAIETGIKP